MTDGERVTIRGTAYDEHAGAVIERPDERSVLVADLDYWPYDVVGRTVEATGRLTSHEISAPAIVGEDGAVTHGIAGDRERLVLLEAEWSVVDAD